MKKNNKIGMTLVELVVVMALIALILAIVIPIISGTVKNQKEKLYDVQIDNIKKGATAWGSANLYLMPHDDGDSISITLGELKSKGFVKKDITNPKTEQIFGDNVLVVVTKKNNTYLYNVENTGNNDQVFDKDAPYIILNGGPTEYVEINGGYNEKGVQARDKDGNQISSITTFIKKNGKTVSDVTTSELGTYIITYVATDISNGKSSSASRNVIVHDTIAPIVMVNGININYKMIVKKGSTFNIPTAVVVDNSGETLTPTIDGTVNTSVEGNYELIYEAKDSSKNTGRLIIMAVVKDIGKEIFINYKVSTSLWTNQDVTMTILPVHNNPLPTAPYSFDGGTSWQTSASKGFANNQAVRMQARDNEGQKSDVVSYTIANIDKTLPTCNITGNPTNWVTNATLTVTGTDGSSGVTGIKLPGSSEYLSLSSTTFNVTSNGTYTASVKDIAGNINTCSVTVTKIDSQSPTCTITGNPTNWVKNATLTITGSDSESGVVGIKKPGDSTYTSTTSSTTFNVTSNATYTAYVIDGVGRMGTCSTTVSKIDNTAPTNPVITNSSNGNWTNSSITLSWSSNDTQSGINYYQYAYSADAPTWTTFESAEQTGIVRSDERNNVLYIRAIDKVGNISTPSSTPMKIDKTAPTCVSSGGSSNWRNTDLTLTGTCSDGASGCVGNVFKSYSANINSTIESPGSVSDNAGNGVTCPANQTVRIDKTAPTTPTVTLKYNSTSGSTYTSGTWTNQNVVQIYSASDALSGTQKYQYSLDKSSWYDIANTWLITDQGNWTFYMRVIDNAGNISGVSSGHTIRIDKTAPTCAASGGSATWRNTNLTITGTCSDTGGSGCVGNASRTYSTDINSMTESPGSVSDNAGNSVTCSANQAVKIDKTAPTCTSSGGSSTWRNTNLTLIGTCSDGGSGCTGNASKTYSNDINSTAESPGSIGDNAGNNVTCPANQTVRIDKTAPTTPTVTLKYNSTSGSAYTSGTWTNQNVVQIYSASDALSGTQKYQYSLDKSSWYDIANTWLIADQGNWTFYMRVIDNAGNISGVSSGHTIRIDKTAPTCASSGGIATWRNTNLTLTGTCSDTGGSGCVGNASKTYSTDINSTTESPGTVSDNAGNSVTCYANQTVKIDKTLPVCTFGGTGEWNTSIILTLTGSDAGSGMDAVNAGDGYVSGSTAQKTVSSAATYAAYTRDNAGNINSCVAQVSSRTEYRYRDCDTCSRCSGAGVDYYNYGSWKYSTSTCSSSRLTPSKSTAESNGGKTYYSCETGTTGFQECGVSSEYYCDKYTRTKTAVYNRSCSSCGCSDWGSWSGWDTTSRTDSSSRDVQTRTTYSAS